MSSADEIKALVAKHGALAALNTQQAAALLQAKESALEKAREKSRRESGGYALLPFHTDNKKRTIYYVTDLIAFRMNSSSHPLPFIMRTLAIMIGEEFCREIKLPFPTTRSTMGTAAPMAPPPDFASMLGMAADTGSVDEEPVAAEEPRERGRQTNRADNRTMIAAQKAGATVRRHTLGFATLHDFLLNAEPDDQWLFACPDDGRPYDAIAAILAGPGDVRFEWLSLTDYLQRTAIHAAQVRDARKAQELAGEMNTRIAKAKSSKKSRSIDD
jgi:hypothetical protein